MPTSLAILPRRRQPATPLQRTLGVGLVFGVIGVYLAAVGLLPMLNKRSVIVDTIGLGDATMIAIGLGAGAMAARHAHTRGGATLHGLLAGAVAGAMAAALAVVMQLVSLQSIFIQLSPALFTMLTLGLGLAGGAAVLIGGGAAAGLAGALLRDSPPGGRRIVLAGLGTVVVAGVFQELIQLVLQNAGALTTSASEFFYTWEGLSQQGAAAIFVIAAIIAGLNAMVQRRAAGRVAASERRVRLRRLLRAGILLLLLVCFPLLAGSYIGQVLMLVGLYILMGMGLNLEVGLAGLLDLGFVAFFAVGAYTTALLTADSAHALAALSYWEAMPIAVLLSICVGVIFGIPVLGVRGDYLAVATMGLGEIVRVIVTSDFAAPLLGGAQGVLQIPKPRIGATVLATPVALFYLTLAASAVAAYVAWRLENSRLGRAWMALRDDEDVAQALGVNLIRSKLLAYGLGAAFAGLGGSIFAVMLSSVYPSSFQLLISINVLALIIVGGMGSLPGVVVGSLALIGLPELLREFGEYRYLFYGAVLVIMMRLKPEGLWPSEVRRRELHAGDEAEALDAGADLLPAGQHASSAAE
ncbi:MAG: branched-chain amino acid ABC transporter permease [Acidisphaera sp.]|nr:branched-chain amino acid ABC transporter permease [Acidisphaera sp.]